MPEANGLPAVNIIGPATPLTWLSGAWRDLWRAPAVFLAYGLAVAMLSAAVSLGLALTGFAFWSIALAAGIVFLAPMIAMGIYEGGRMLEMHERPSFTRIAFVRRAFRRDVALLGLALFLVFGIWLELALITRGLATSRIYPTLDAFIAFAVTTSAGHTMLIWGTAIGGALAWLTFSLVVVSAPMLLDTRHDIFTATVTSVRCVVKNTLPMLLWATIIAALILASVATGFLGLIIVIPWLGLASWRAYRELVNQG